MATTTMNWDNLIKAVEIDVVDSASDAKMVEPTVLMIQKLRLTSAVLPTAVSVICVCIACAMTRGMRQTSKGSCTPTAPNMPRGAAEHADVIENSYVTATDNRTMLARTTVRHPVQETSGCGHARAMH